jgi:hypothetical protein
MVTVESRRDRHAVKGRGASAHHKEMRAEQAQVATLRLVLEAASTSIRAEGVIGWGGPRGSPTATFAPMLPVMGTKRPGKRRPIATTDLAVLGSGAAASARLREEHLWPVVLDSMTLIREAIHNAVPDRKPSALIEVDPRRQRREANR